MIGADARTPGDGEAGDGERRGGGGGLERAVSAAAAATVLNELLKRERSEAMA